MAAQQDPTGDDPADPADDMPDTTAGPRLTHHCGEFGIDETGQLWMPPKYARERGNALVDRIEAGADPEFTAILATLGNVEDAMLARLTLDHYRWKRERVTSMLLDTAKMIRAKRNQRRARGSTN